MVLTEKDIPVKPIIKKPKTLNPLGAMLFGACIGGSQILLYESFISKRFHILLGVAGIILVLISIFFILAANSLSSKYAVFNTIIESSKTLQAQSGLQIVLFYIGFFPIYGITLVYGSPTIINITKMGIISIIILVLFAMALIINVYILRKERASIGYLKQLFFQPKKLLIISLCSLPSLIAIFVYLLF